MTFKIEISPLIVISVTLRQQIGGVGVNWKGRNKYFRDLTLFPLLENHVFVAISVPIIGQKVTFNNEVVTGEFLTFP